MKDLKKGTKIVLLPCHENIALIEVYEVPSEVSFSLLTDEERKPFWKSAFGAIEFNFEVGWVPTSPEKASSFR